MAIFTITHLEQDKLEYEQRKNKYRSTLKKKDKSPN